MEKDEIIDVVRNMKPTDHVIMFYEFPEDKHHVLFTYLKAGLDSQEAAAYVAGDEKPDEIREAMKKFGIDVDYYERKGMLHIINYNEWYIIDGKFSIEKTVNLWKTLLDDATAKGFNGLRVTGEMTCFFKYGMINELVEYENSLHRVLDIPLTAICAYSLPLMVKKNQTQLIVELIKAHSTVIIVGPKAGLVKSY
jgi:hypothetical protein